MEGTKSILVLLVILLLFEYVECYGWGYPGGYYGGYRPYGGYGPYGGYRPLGWGYGGGMLGRGFGGLGSLLGKKK
ncbi:putative integral membrane protein [Brugia pahangi]|uniref:Neuropeptide-like protein 31 n=1 Tax=Brugia pahangi TaxID=6280 RepID=A0A0N4TZ54_BRUPA|nr:unnamed protein product [Brugia pahangi]